MMKRDNSVYPKKVAIRRYVLAQVDAPVVMETHGGNGKLFNACYSHIARGIVFEKDAEKADLLARQRPTWAVYEADCVSALKLGAGAHLPVNFVDIDPYGEPWPVIDALLTSQRPRTSPLYLVVTDGMNYAMNSFWRAKSTKKFVLKYGSYLRSKYLSICCALLEEKAAQAGYSLSQFDGYQCGFSKMTTHYYAVLTMS